MTGILARVFFLAVAVPICLGQADQTSVHVVPRVLQGSPSTKLGSSGEDKPGPVKVDVDLVLVPVTVTDQMDRLVLGLERDRFSVYERNREQAIRHLSTEDAPLSLGVIFDTSSSMYGKIERCREAVVQFLRSANPKDEFFLIGFGDRPELLVDFTSSVEEIQSEISKTTPNGVTALLDAVYLGLDRMKEARNERKALLIVSEGGENHSRYSTKEVWSVVREAGVQIYAMGIFDEAPRTKAERMGPDFLAAITSITGGRTFPINNLKRIEEAADQLALELRNQYLVAYHPNNLVHDGRWHKISVHVVPPQTSPRLRIYAKAGYYAPAQ
jgi:Ca-activated chloride channel family protein